MSELLINTPEKAEKRIKELEEQEKREREEREQAKKNRDFVMFYRDYMPELRWLTKVNPKAHSFLLFIIEHMDGKNALACSYAVFQDYFEISPDTVRRNLKFLKENGFIDVLKMGTSNLYTVNHEVAWNSWANQKEYSKFNGNMIISRKENKDYAYRSQFDKFKSLREREGIK